MKYLFYVNFALSGFRAYVCETDDPFHTMGEMHYRTMERIDRLTFREYNETSVKYITEEKGLKINEWKDKYRKQVKE